MKGVVVMCEWPPGAKPNDKSPVTIKRPVSMRQVRAGEQPLAFIYC